MKSLEVYYAGWGEDWLLGTLADDDQHLLFEYSQDALTQGLELSPYHLPLAAKAYGDFPPSQFRLPGLMADSLPDGWGLLLMDRVFRQLGLRHPGPLDRLAFIGDRAMGALRYMPPALSMTHAPHWDLRTLVDQNRRVLSRQASSALRELAYVGGSPQGARPKGLVQFDPATDAVSTRADAPGAPWLVKFPAKGEHHEVCAIEHAYAQLARDSGIEVPETRLFELGPDMAAFGIARFDRAGHLRVPTHTLAGLLHVDYRIPGSTDYSTFLRATRFLTRDQREVEKAFTRAVFNIAFHNRDDHPKNFAWRLGRDRHWRLAPVYDLTFSEGPQGQHHTDLAGKGSDITRDDLLGLARENDVAERAAEVIIDRILSAASSLRARLDDLPVRAATARTIAAEVAACGQLLR